MDRYKYRAMNSKGRPVRGVVVAANEADLMNRLAETGLELIDCSPVAQKKGLLSFSMNRVKIRDMVQLFISLEQLQSAGVPLLDSLEDIRDTTDNVALRDMMTDIHKDVTEGSSLSESMANHPKVFKQIFISIIAAGEENGDIVGSFRHLVAYLKWTDDMQRKIKKAIRYPTILLVVLIGAVSFLMGVVVPQIVGFLDSMEMELPWFTTSLMATSSFFAKYWWGVIGTPILLMILIKFLRSMSKDMLYRIDMAYLYTPVFGSLIRKINLSRYCQTFGALFASGVDILQCLATARETVTNTALQQAMETVELQVREGSPMAAAFATSGEFPSLVVRMIKVGEESGNLKGVLDQVTEFYNNDVSEAVDALIQMIEPALTAVFGILMCWIAVGVFGPIYLSFENMDI